MRLALNSFIDPALTAHVEGSREVNAQRGTRRGPSNLDELRQVRATASGGSSVVEAGGRRVPVRILEPGGVRYAR